MVVSLAGRQNDKMVSFDVVTGCFNGHVLKPETTKRNERNETTETSETKPPKQAKRPKRVKS